MKPRAEAVAWGGVPGLDGPVQCHGPCQQRGAVAVLPSERSPRSASARSVTVHQADQLVLYVGLQGRST